MYQQDYVLSQPSVWQSHKNDITLEIVFIIPVKLWGLPWKKKKLGGEGGSLCLKLKERKNVAFSVLHCKLILLHLNQDVSTYFIFSYFIYCILHSCDFILHFKNIFPKNVFLNSKISHNLFTWSNGLITFENIIVYKLLYQWYSSPRFCL